MDYKTALAKIQGKKTKDNFLVVELGYDHKIVMPYKDGITFLNALVNAERFHDTYSKPKSISGVDRESIKSTLMSYEEYEAIKVSALLNITLEEVKELALNTA